MIYVIDNSNRARHRPLIDQLFQIQAASIEGAIHLLEPPNLNAASWGEDGGDDALYAIETDSKGDVRAGICLLPTTQPNLLQRLPSNAFATGQPVQDDAIFVLSHCFASVAGGVLSRRKSLSSLFGAVAEYGYHHGLTHIVALCETESLSAFLALDLIAVPLALPFQSEKHDRDCIVLLIELQEPEIGFSDRASGQSSYH